MKMIYPKKIWIYVRDAVRNHPFNALTLVIAFFAALFAGLSWMEAKNANKSSDDNSTKLLDKMAQQTQEMKNQVAQMNRAASAQEGNSRSTEALVQAAERNALASESNAKASLKSLGALISHYDEERQANLQITDVVAGSARRGSHTELTLKLKNIGGSAATRLTFSYDCSFMDEHVTATGGVYYTQRQVQGCHQRFYKALIGRNEEFPESNDFFPAISNGTDLRITATLAYVGEEHGKVNSFTDCYYVFSNYHIGDCARLDPFVHRK